eukprot:5112960-Pleurochrysis_carterae.AAC.2
MSLTPRFFTTIIEVPSPLPNLLPSTLSQQPSAKFHSLFKSTSPISEPRDFSNDSLHARHSHHRHNHLTLTVTMSIIISTNITSNNADTSTHELLGTCFP